MSAFTYIAPINIPYSTMNYTGSDRSLYDL